MIKVIAFDYNGVITKYGPIKKWINDNLSTKDKRYLLYNENAPKWDSGELTLDQMYNILSVITGVPADKLWATFFEKQILNKEVIELIENLRLTYKVILFSNHQAELLTKLIRMHGIGNLFDDIIASSDHKLIKPSKESYELLLKFAGVGKDEIIFIDDSLENVEGGNKFGIKSIHFITPAQLKIDLDTLLTKQQ